MRVSEMIIVSRLVDWLVGGPPTLFAESVNDARPKSLASFLRNFLHVSKSATASVSGFFLLPVCIF